MTAERDARELLREWHKGWRRGEHMRHDLAERTRRYFAANPEEGARIPEPAGEEAPSLTFTLREAKELVETFGGHDAEMVVRRLPAGAVKDIDDDEHHSPAGLFAHCSDYPEEGCIYLGPCEVDDDWPAATPIEGARIPREPTCAHEWREMRSATDPYRDDECRWCGVAKAEAHEEAGRIEVSDRPMKKTEGPCDAGPNAGSGRTDSIGAHHPLPLSDQAAKIAHFDAPSPIAPDDLVGRLRQRAKWHPGHEALHNEAAARIEADAREIAQRMDQEREFDAACKAMARVDCDRAGAVPLSQAITEFAAASRQREQATSERNVEVSMLAYRWMEAHDSLKAGEPYELPRPADLPECRQREQEKDAEIAKLRSAVERAEYCIRLLIARKPVRDVTETLAEIASALAAPRAAPDTP